MAISSISSNDPTASSQNPTDIQKVRDDFQQLSAALSSNNLTQAQAAYSSLNTDAPGLFQGNNPGSQQLAAIGQALQSGDLSGAQQAFSALQQTAESHRHHRHHQTGSSGGGAMATDTDTPATIGSQISVRG